MRYPFPLQMRANMSNEAREWCTDDAVVGNALSRVVRDSEPNLNYTIVYIYIYRMLQSNPLLSQTPVSLLQKHHRQQHPLFLLSPPPCMIVNQT